MSLKPFSFSLIFCFILFASASGQTISSVMSTGNQMVVDAAGNVYFNERVAIKKRSPAGVVTTIAGTGTGGYSGDGGPATAAQMYSMGYLAIDGSGNIYFLDTTARLRKVNSTGIITTIAGIGIFGTTGDGGPATAAQISGYSGLVADATGNVYFASASARIRKVSASGTITTIAGTGVAGYSGDGGPATSATIDFYSRSLAVDVSGNVYFTDHSSNRLRMINVAGTISTFAGTGTAGYSGDGGPATAATINYPRCIASDNSGNIYISDANYRIRKINSAGIITTIAGTGVIGCSGDGGPALAAQVFYPWSIGVDAAGTIYFSDGECGMTRKISTTSAVTNIAAYNALSIIPTVNNGDFTISGALNVTTSSDLSIEVTDMAGKVVHKSMMHATGGNINEKIFLAGGVADGMYFLTLHAQDHSSTYKFIVQN